MKKTNLFALCGGVLLCCFAIYMTLAFCGIVPIGFSRTPKYVLGFFTGGAYCGAVIYFTSFFRSLKGSPQIQI
jgi:hypothetical protein